MTLINKMLIVGALALAAGNAAATDGQIIFNGEIIESTCEINTPNREVNVELGSYNRYQFRAAGDRSPKIPFTLPLINCPMTAWEHIDGTKDASFQLWLETRSGGTVVNHPDLAKVSSMTTAAGGVGIQIEDAKTQTIIPLNRLATPKISYKITGATMNVDLFAYYVSTEAPADITAGEADAAVDVTLDYR